MMVRLRSMIALAMVALVTTQADAGSISTIFGVGGPGTVSVNGGTGIVNNQINNYTANGTQSVNFETISKTFTAVGPLDITFNVVKSNGLTSYFFDETVTNNTKVTFTDFHVLLGTGGQAFANNPWAQYPAVGAPVNFDASYKAFGSMKLQSQVLNEVDFVEPTAIAPGKQGTFKFQFVVSDDAVPPGNFTIREIPTIAAQYVPEPSSVVLMGVGLLGLYGAWHRSARRRSRRP